MSNPQKPQDLYRLYHQLTQQTNAIFEQESNDNVILKQQVQALTTRNIELEKLLEKSTPKEIEKPTKK